MTAVILYWAHCFLRLQYYRHCNSSLIRIVFIGQSNMCTHAATVLHVVEVAVEQTVRHMTAHALTMLRGVLGTASTPSVGGFGGGFQQAFGGGGGYF